ncbi:hypothetical protein [Sphingosinicella terrae]|jgi:hypothetical protein|uniref:hypothetical protein n=1 Tax=Sphingosinicella terrae TaxID=2172047 RepID=UPI000E0D116B|nr:hypothetical protein [Sphingosinicella terrae]
MNSGRTEELFVGLVALILVPVIAARILRGLRTGRLPLYRTSIHREDDRAKFGFLLALHAASLALIALVAIDLLFGLRLKESLL